MPEYVVAGGRDAAATNRAVNPLPVSSSSTRNHVTPVLAFSQSLINESTARYRNEWTPLSVQALAGNDSTSESSVQNATSPLQRLASGTDSSSSNSGEKVVRQLIDGVVAATSSSSTGNGGGSSSSVGAITVGGLIGIIAGVLTALVLACK